MISFTCDYSEGAHPEVLRRLCETNMVQEPGYGNDRFTASAKERIRAAVGLPEADVWLLTGGTQTNATVIDALLSHCEAVVCAESGHIAVHEAGAIEHSGHKVITLPAHEGKLRAADLEAYMRAFCGDSARAHMAQPGMVYISQPTEWGTLYDLGELSDLHDVCRACHMPLYVDGARLGYALASPACTVGLADLARLCDVFYIGGTKVGALCGEAVVFTGGPAPRHFFSIVKQHGALLAKGRLTGVQFDALFTDGLYLTIARHAIEMASALRDALAALGVGFYVDSPTNQLFPVLHAAQRQALDQADVRYETWQSLPDGRTVCRLATSWATPPDHVAAVVEVLRAAEAGR